MADLPTLTPELQIEWARSVIKPLCEGSDEILAPLRLYESDTISIDIDRKAEWFVATIKGSFEARHTFPRRIPERKDHSSRDTLKEIGADPNAWRFAATDLTAVITSLIWPRDQIIFRSPAAQMRFDFLLLRYAGEMGGAEMRARFKLNGELPPQNGLTTHPDFPLGPHQIIGAMSTLNLFSFALFMDRGTGKTYTLLTRAIHDALKIRAEKGRMARVLIVCPKSARYNWKREIEKFTSVVCKVTIVVGNEVSRIGCLVEAVTPDEDCVMTVVIVSYDLASRMCKTLAAIPWDLTALDESHRIKNVNAKRWKKILSFRDNSDVRAILTGTPITNQVLDLYAQLEFLEAGGSGFLHFKEFKNFYTKYVNRGDGQAVIAGYKNLPLLQERFARMAFHITKEEALPHLPPKLYETISCKMSKTQMKAYKEMAELLVTKFESQSGKNKELSTENQLTQLLRLAQITGGFVKWNDTFDLETQAVVEKGDIEFFDENDKLDKMIEQIKETGPNEKHIVWSCFVPLIGLIMNRLEKEGIGAVSYWGHLNDKQREEAERAFNCDPTIKCMVVNQAAGGEAINLRGYDERDPINSTTNTSQEHFYAVNWSVVQRLQAEDRAHRTGTRVPVTIKDYVVAGSIDDRLRDHVNDKIDTARTIQDVQQILTNIMASLETLAASMEEGDEDDDD